MKELKRKRYKQTFKRYIKVRARNLDLETEAVELEREEIYDKKLNREPPKPNGKSQENWVGFFVNLI